MAAEADLKHDTGSILPIVFVIVVVLGAVVAAVATYATQTLRFGQVAESRADRLAAAQAATDDALEQLTLKRAFSVCSTSAGSGTGISNPFPEVINGSTVAVTCRLANSTATNNEGFALVVTGEGVQPGTPTLDLNNGGDPEITGPVYVHDPARVDLQKLTTIREGDLWYQDTATTEGYEDAGNPCDVSRTGASVEFDRVAFLPADQIDNLQFSPAGPRGLYCVNRSWNQLFAAPTTATLPTSSPESYDPGDPDHDGCTVFKPGLYSQRPVLGSSNYFKSGVYQFQNVGTIELPLKTVVTFGNTLQIGFPAVANDACVIERQQDDVTGAVVYVSGNTRFVATKNESGLEISGRQIGAGRVALQVLSTTLDPDDTPLIHAENGNKREFTFNGQVWAPTSWLDFETIPAAKNAIMRGGAVVARITGDVSGAANDFKIEVSSTVGEVQFVIEAVATDSRGSTTVRTVADYRPSNGDIAVRSRRVIW